MSEPTTTAEQFKTLFTGYSDSYVKHTPPFTRDDEGKVKAGYVGIAQYRSNNRYCPAPPEGRKENDTVPLTAAHYRAHLNGEEGIAISALCDTPTHKDICFFSVIDIDVYGDDVDYLPLVRRLHKYGYKFTAFDSKSGGIHLYFFYQAPEAAAQVIVEMKRIVERFGLNKIYQKGGKSRVEVFPQHSQRTAGQHDECLFLPFYNSAGGTAQKLLADDGVRYSIVKSIPMIENAITSLAAVAKATDELPYSDAPFCVQMLQLSGSMDALSGRNDYLFTAAIYLKTKHTDALTKEHIEEMNNDLPDPLEQKEITGMFGSVSKTDYQLAGRCKKSPMVDFCDKKLCRERTFGVGRTKKNMVSNVEFGEVVRMLAETPYYLWEARLAGTEEYKQLRIDGAENFMNQKYIQKVCIDKLGQLSVTVSIAMWEKTVNECLANIVDIEVPRATDTTEMSALRDLFMRYLTNKQTRNSSPYTVKVKQVYYDTVTRAFYFKNDGLTSYLFTMKFTLGRTNLREQLVSYGCVEGDLRYTINGKEKVEKCWRKDEDDELIGMGTFYDDITEADADVIASNTLNKQDRGGATPEDTRF